MATNAPIGEPWPTRTWIGDPPYTPPGTYIDPWAPYSPYTPPTIYPLTFPYTTTGTTTHKLRLMSKDVRDLLDLIHDELLASDDADHLALAELIEETLDQ